MRMRRPRRSLSEWFIPEKQIPTSVSPAPRFSTTDQIATAGVIRRAWLRLKRLLKR